MRPIVSVIIPVYNVQQYLERCLDSILLQSFPNYEVILVDDGSRDNSGWICDVYAEKHSHIKVFHKKNEGVSSARNLGLSIAKGDYIVFVDSDDYVSRDYLKSLMDDLQNNIDIVIHGLYKTNANNEVFGKIRDFNLSLYATELTEQLNKNQLLRYGYVYSCLFRRDIIIDHNLSFDKNIPYAEDLIFLLDYMSNCKGLIYYNSAINYFYNLGNPSSAIRKLYDVETNKYFINKIYGFQKHTLEISDINEYPEIRQINYIYFKRFLNSVQENKNNLKKKYHYLNKVEREVYLYFLLDVNAKDKIKNFLLKNRLFGAYLTMNFLIRRVKLRRK